MKIRCMFGELISWLIIQSCFNWIRTMSDVPNALDIPLAKHPTTMKGLYRLMTFLAESPNTKRSCSIRSWKDYNPHRYLPPFMPLQPLEEPNFSFSMWAKEAPSHSIIFITPEDLHEKISEPMAVYKWHSTEFESKIGACAGCCETLGRDFLLCSLSSKQIRRRLSRPYNMRQGSVQS